MSVLGAWAELTREERMEKIRTHRCNPTPDALTVRLLRIVWLHHVHHTFKVSSPWKRVLDIGCHDGFATRWMVDEPNIEKLVGIDLCEHAVCWANELIKTRKHPEKATYELGDWMKAEIDEPFDAVVCFELLEHLDNDEIEELFFFIDRAVSPGGVLLLTTPNIDGPVGKSNPDEQHINLFSPERLEATFQEHIPSANKEDFDVRLDVTGTHIHLLWRESHSV